ncbi:MAG: hypothetical protein KBC43_11900 [Bacteroidales bacterium]|nr:hypothetical protein [Bacteroidales bacterium]
MEDKANVKELVKLINKESFFIIKQFGMYGGFTFEIVHITPEMVYINAKAERNLDKKEHFIRSFINSLVNLLQDIVPAPHCQVMYYSNRYNRYPDSVGIYPFYRKSEGEHESNVIFIEENVSPIREKIRKKCGDTFRKI